MKTSMKVLTLAMGIAFSSANAAALSAQEAPKGGGKMTDEQMRAKAQEIAAEKCKGIPDKGRGNCEAKVFINAYETIKSKQ